MKDIKKIIRKLILSTSIFLIILFYGWVADAIYQVHIPEEVFQVELYSTEMQDDLALTMSKAIDQAEKSVTLVIYNLSNSKIINSLKKKSNTNCEVKVISHFKNASKLIARLGPKVSLLKRDFNGLMHIKMLIIDNRQTWIGSANMSTESLRHYGNLMLAINCEALAEFASSKARSLFSSDDFFIPIPHRIFSLGTQNIELWFLPDDPMALSRLKKLIQSAQKSLRIAMYTWTRDDLAQEVINAKNRGIKVEVVIDKTAAMSCCEHITKNLLTNGINLRMSTGAPLLHHKCMIIDHSILVNGSANWTRAAFEDNDDCFIILSPLLEEQQQFLDKMWSRILTDSAPAQ